MSFYLLPPVSYQTQQKLKRQMNEKKSSRSKSRSQSRSQSRSSHSSTRSSQSPSLDSKSFDLNSILLPNSKLLDLERSESSLEEGKKSTFNYECNSDINEIMKYNKDHHRKSQTRHHKKNSMSASSSMYTRTSFETEPEVKVNFKEVNFGGETLQEPAQISKGETIREEEIEDFDNESLPELTKEYSNVSSIFSTKKDDKLSKNKLFKRKSITPPSSTENSPKIEIISNAPPVKSNKFAAKLKKKFS